MSASDLAGYRAHVHTVIAGHRPPGETVKAIEPPGTRPKRPPSGIGTRPSTPKQIVGGGWPVEWGGNPDHSPLHDVIATEELLLARAPRPLDQVQLASHLILQFGSPRQKSDYLPRIRSGEHVWCQLFSEPDAGSDLAGIKTRATMSDDGSFVLRGQKTWTTDGHWADMGIALVRTGGDGTRHRTLTVFLIPMTATGLSVVPLTTIGGLMSSMRCSSTMSSWLRQPSSAKLAAGGSVAMAGLEAERFGVGGNVILLKLLLDDLVTVARSASTEGPPPIEHEHVLTQIIELTAEAEAATAFVNDHINRATRGRGAGSDAPIGKLLYSETYNRIARFGVQLMAEYPVIETTGMLAAQRLATPGCGHGP